MPDTHKLTLRLPENEVERLRQLAAASDRSVNWLVNHALSTWLLELETGARLDALVPVRRHKDQIPLPLDPPTGP